MRLIAHDWPFLYSVLPNGDLVHNKRVEAPAKEPRKRQQPTVLVEED